MRCIKQNENSECELFPNRKTENCYKFCNFFEPLESHSTVNHPSHYTSRQHECIDEMICVFGYRAVIDFCKCNAWKYRYRADSKGSHDEDLDKADWYISKAMEIQEKYGVCHD